MFSKRRSGPAEAKKSKGDAQKVLVRGPKIPKVQDQGEIACWGIVADVSARNFSQTTEEQANTISINKIK